MEEEDYLSRTSPQAPVVASYWFFAQAFDALLDGVERTGRYRGLVETFYRAHEPRGWLNNLFDDQNWMTLALTRAYRLTGNPLYLARARAIFKDIMTHAPDSTCCGPEPGGLWWNREHSCKATCANAGAVISAARLYGLTEDPSYLTFATRVYHYWLSHMVDPKTFQVADNIGPDGKILWWRFTYNEGLMIGASVELHRVTGSLVYLELARFITDFLLEHETVATPFGRVLADRAPCTGDCPAFKGVTVRYLAQLQQVAPRDEVADLLRASAASVWSAAKAKETDHFNNDWTVPPTMPLYFVEQDVAAAMALSIGAQLESPYRYQPTPGVFQAEEGVLRGVRIEAKQAGHEGWGYVAGGLTEDAGVEIDLEGAPPGPQLALVRYAAPDGDAVREVLLQGQVVVERQRFPRTSAGAFGTVSIPLQLSSAPARIAIRYGADHGSTGALALDQIALQPAEQ
jgi:predicted alpha-1,6-mannanase (GH76 family)